MFKEETRFWSQKFEEKEERSHEWNNWLEKCLIQSKDFSSDSQSIDMMEIDLSKLLEEQGFNVHSQIAYNGLSFFMITLADTEANDFLFIDI